MRRGLGLDSYIPTIRVSPCACGCYRLATGPPGPACSSCGCWRGCPMARCCASGAALGFADAPPAAAVHPHRPPQHRAVPARAERPRARAAARPRTSGASGSRCSRPRWRGGAARSDIDRIVKVEGREHIEAALALGKGVILLTAHFTPLEMGGRILARVVPLNILYRPTEERRPGLVPGPLPLAARRRPDRARRHPRSDLRAQEQRVRLVRAGPGLPQKGRGDGADVRHSRGHEYLHLAPGADDRRNGAAATSSSACPARRVTAPIIHPPLKNFPSDSPAADTARFHQLIEAQVRNAPSNTSGSIAGSKASAPTTPTTTGASTPPAPRLRTHHRVSATTFWSSAAGSTARASRAMPPGAGCRCCCASRTILRRTPPPPAPS